MIFGKMKKTLKIYFFFKKRCTNHQILLIFTFFSFFFSKIIGFCFFRSEQGHMERARQTRRELLQQKHRGIFKINKKNEKNCENEQMLMKFTLFFKKKLKF